MQDTMKELLVLRIAGWLATCTLTAALSDLSEHSSWRGFLTKDLKGIPRTLKVLERDCPVPLRAAFVIARSAPAALTYTTGRAA